MTDGRRQLDEVVAILNKESLTWRRMPQSPLATLVKLMTYRKAHTMLFRVFTTNKNYVDTPSRELETFKRLQLKYPWLRTAAETVFANVTRYEVSPREHWVISEVLHFLYDLPKELIYCEIVKRWTLILSVEIDSDGAWTKNDMMDLIGFMTWTVTKDVAKSFTDPYNYFTRLALHVWAAQSVDSEISPSLTFATTMRLMPFNIRAIYPDGSFSSLQDILEDGAAPDNIAAHILYPNVFGPPPEPETVQDIVQAIRTALWGGASLQQIQQIYPYTTSPTRAALMADIARAALSVGRMDIAEAYGFGPSFLAYLDTTPFYGRHELDGSVYPGGWHIFDLMREVPKSERLSLLQSLGFDLQSAQELIHEYQYSYRSE